MPTEVWNKAGVHWSRNMKKRQTFEFERGALKLLLCLSNLFKKQMILILNFTSIIEKVFSLNLAFLKQLRQYLLKRQFCDETFKYLED